MLVYQDLVSGDDMLSDAFTRKELFNGVLWEVEGKWVTTGFADVDSLIRANASEDGGGEDESVDDQSVKAVNIIDMFSLKEQPAFDEKGFKGYMLKYMRSLTPLVSKEREGAFKEGMQLAAKFLLSKLSDLQFFVGESMNLDGTMVFAYYKDGKSDPTFLYFGDALKEVKC